MNDIIVWKCSRCKQVKPVSEFSKDRLTRKGFRSHCKLCQAKDDKRYAERNQEKIRKREKIYRSTQGRQKRHENSRKKNLKKYNITPEQYETMLVRQNGRCAICGGLPNGKRLSVDHDHKTGEIRGLLCQACNQGIGYLKESKPILTGAIEYLFKK